MPTQIDLAEFRVYLASAFPGARLNTHPIDFGHIHLRFELGGDHPNGSNKRILQATERATALFQESNTITDEIILVINDWNENRNELWPSEPPEYLFSLIRGFDVALAYSAIVESDEHISTHRQTYYPTSAEQLDYTKILGGIANLEQGRTPCISESIYFVNKSNNTVFYMYDDRGCLIYSDVSQTLHRLYSQRNDWLVEYHRAHFDEVFGKIK